MWITKKLLRTTGAGLSTGVRGDGNNSRIISEAGSTEPITVFPYGFYSKAPQGESAVLLENVCLGFETLGDAEIQQGEVVIRSVGGAEIKLKNDGTVVINGQSFAAKIGGVG